MSTLPERLWQRRFWIAALVALIVLVLLDSSRRPADQYTAAAYVGGVRVYQALALKPAQRRSYNGVFGVRPTRFP